MPLSIAEQIIAAFTAKVQTLTANPVERVRRAEFEGAGLQISVWDGDEEASLDEYDIQHVELPIALNIQQDFGAINPSTLANEIIANATSALIGIDPELNGLAESVIYTGSTKEYPSEKSNYLALIMVFTIRYRTDYGDPFTQS